MTAQGRTGKQGLVTSKQLATSLDCHPRSIAKWLDEGAPVAVRGRGGRPSLYDEEAFTTWVQAREEQAQHSPDLLVSRARKEMAQALEAEQRVALKARTLIHVDDVERVWSAQVSAIRSRLLAMPTELADKLHRVATLDGVAGVETVLEAAVHDVLRELAGGIEQDVPALKTPARKAQKKRRASRKRRS
jgi:phage terminase Nu1 subunit (DNA packaging protein)